jgi:hypothetical protein
VTKSLAIRWFFAVFVAAALVFAPVYSAEASIMEATMLAGEMPCCPDEAPQKTDCKACNEMVLCSAKSFHAIPVAVEREPAPAGRIEALLPASDLAINDFHLSPPSRPPRS